MEVRREGYKAADFYMAARDQVSGETIWERNSKAWDLAEKTAQVMNRKNMEEYLRRRGY